MRWQFKEDVGQIFLHKVGGIWNVFPKMTVKEDALVVFKRHRQVNTEGVQGYRSCGHKEISLIWRHVQKTLFGPKATT